MAADLSRDHWRRLAVCRENEAKVLYRSREWSGVYYLAGLSVECALKAAIAKEFKRNVWPEKMFVNSIYTHKLTELIKLAGLKDDLDARESIDADFKLRWGFVKDWTVEARYQQWKKRQAHDMLDAVTHDRCGVLPWIKDRR